MPWCEWDNRLDAWCKPPIRTCVYGWNLSTWIQPWSRLINTSIPGILKPQLYPIVQQERKRLFQRLCGVLLYSMGGLARPRVNLWHRLGSQPPPALRVARDTACHSARSIPPPVDIMCVQIYTGYEYLLCANIYWVRISTGCEYLLGANVYGVRISTVCEYLLGVDPLF